MPFDQLNLQARWSFTPKDHLLVQLDSLNIEQGALKVALSGRHQMPLQAQA
ncbi:hypothetical protein LP419_09915 [Massilia sp. H-1]|nr:hypothetical protein LP419_09915 [Massilia sp. H-1]